MTHKLLERSGMKVDEFDAVECNEAFAAIALMWQKEFSYDKERFNPRAVPSPSGTRSAPVACASWGRCSTTSRRPAAAMATRRCAKAVGRPTAPSSSAWADPRLALRGRLLGQQRLDLAGHDEPLDHERQSGGRVRHRTSR